MPQSTIAPPVTVTCRRPTASRALAVVALVLGAVFAAPAARAQEAGEGEGVPPKVQESVDRALAWMAANQKPDGTWPQAGSSKTAVPSLAVMAFLARGHVPGQGPYGDLLHKTVDFVLAAQQDSGLLSSPQAGNAAMYEHGISTVMLSEVYGMVDDRRRDRIDRALARSVKFILDAQRPNGQDKAMPYTGGWRYSPTAADSDISVTGWQLMALRGAANCGAAVPKSALDAGVEYVKRSAVAGGGFGYQPGAGGANQARTGTGILSMSLLGQHTPDRPLPEVTAAAEWLLNNPPSSPGQEFYFYSVYYNAQALNQLGGKYWDTIYPKLRDALLAAQQPNGTWAGGAGEENAAGEGYRTSMAVLALCVPYRYLPLYQK